jgi:hypothetical protein|tara:strand:- start:229 stop:402 length:174 start_codon:yes stop_codon:yes gene_type:complete
MGLPQLLLILIFPTLFGFLGKYIANQKGRESMEGFLLGFFLSIFGIIIVALLPSKDK